MHIHVSKKIFMAAVTAALLLPISGYAESVPLSLQDSFNLAMQNNEAIKQSEETVEKTKWGLSQARRSAGPSLSLSGNYQKIGGTSYSSYRSYHDMDSSYPAYEYQLTHVLTASIPVYTGGEIEGYIQGAEYGLQANENSYERTRQEISRDVAKSYYTLLQCNMQINVRQQAVDLLSAHMREVTARYEEGLYSRSDVWQTEVKWDNAREELVSAKRDALQSNNALANLIGLPKGDKIDATDKFDFIKWETPEPACISYALENRPDIKAANYAVEKAKKDIDVVKSNNRPKVSAEISRTRQGDGLDKTTNQTDEWYAGLQMSWNIFDNNVNNAKVKQAEADLKNAESVLRDAKKGAATEVENAYAAMLAAAENIEISKNSISVAENSYKVALARYEEGIDTNLHVLDSANDLTTVKVNYYKALYDYNVACAELKTAMGIQLSDSGI